MTSNRSTPRNAARVPDSMNGKVCPARGYLVANSRSYQSFRAIIFSVDRTDRKILAALERDGRLTVTELAARVHLSVSPCHRRLRELERSGAIRGYRAVIDPASVGLGFQALVFASLRQGDRET